MLSHKNKFQSFVYEEELDHSQNRKARARAKPQQYSLIESQNAVNFALKDSSGSINLKASHGLNSQNLNNTTNNMTTENSSENKVVLKVGGEEFQLEGEHSFVLLNYLKDIKSIYDAKNRLYLLPNWIDKKHFEIYLNLLLLPTQTITNKISIDIIKRVMDISYYLKTFSLIKAIISDSILPNLEKHTCLRVIKDYIEFIYEEDAKELFVPLIQKCVEIASNNIFYLINNLQDDLFSITKDSLEEIVERYFESVMFNVNIDHSLIMRIMMKSRKLSDIYELLENERRRSISVFEKLYEEALDPTIIWKIETEQPSVGFYKESEEFLFENVSLILIIYYDHQKDTYSIALKITDIKDKNNLTVETDVSQFILSILSICEIKEINFKSKINFNCIFSNTKTKILISKIENFSELFTQTGLKFEEIRYSLVIYFNISYNFSSILTHICKNFYEYYSLNTISRISRNVLNIIIKNESLNVRSEDEVLMSVVNWINNRSNVTGESALDVVKNINWSAISLDGLLDFILSQSKLLSSCNELETILITEFSRRFREEYCTGNTDNASNVYTNLIDSQVNVTGNSPSPGKRLNFTMQSVTPNSGTFTSELIKKIIKIASKYETSNHYKSPAQNQNSKTTSKEKQFNAQRINEDSKVQNIKKFSESEINSKSKIIKEKEDLKVSRGSSQVKFIDNSSVRMCSASPFAHGNKKKKTSLIRSSNNNFNNYTGLKSAPMRNKILQNSLLSRTAHSHLSASVNRLHKTPDNLSEFADQTLLKKTKSRSIADVERANLKIYPKSKQSHLVNNKIKYSPIFNFSKTSLSINLNLNNTSVNNRTDSVSNNCTASSNKVLLNDTVKKTKEKEGPILNKLSTNSKIKNNSGNLTNDLMANVKPVNGKFRVNEVTNFGNVKFTKKDNINNSDRSKSANWLRKFNSVNVFK